MDDDATSHLLRHPANARRLRASMGELEGRKDSDQPDEVIAGLHAHSHALSLLHTEVTEFRQEMGQFFDEVRHGFAEMRDRLTSIETTLAQIATRLPEPTDEP